MANAKPFKVYEFNNIEANIYSGYFECVEELREKFKKQPTEFQARWRYPVKTAKERKAREWDLLQFGRRMLQAAALQATMVNRDIGHEIEGWEAAASQAAKACKELRRFLRSAVKPAPPKPLKTGTQAAPEATLRETLKAAPEEAFAGVLEISWLQMLAARSKGQTDLDAMRHQAKSKVRLLMDAAAELDSFAQFTGAHHRHLKAARSNPGNPQKVRFAVEMMRGWVFLFGSIPKVHDKDFPLFLSKAWNDICQNAADADDERWDYAIRQARKKVRPEETSLSRSGPWP